VFANVDNQSTIGQEEIFGPVTCVIAADDERHAIQLANDTPYGLNSVVFTNDADRALEVAGQLRSGTVGHNAPIYDFPVAFGGWKQSGVGRGAKRSASLPGEQDDPVVDQPPRSPKERNALCWGAVRRASTQRAT
jgi:betaine-aldehyde dehydrogenase